MADFRQLMFRTCRMCGGLFIGTNSKKYCDTCRLIRQSEVSRARYQRKRQEKAEQLKFSEPVIQKPAPPVSYPHSAPDEMYECAMCGTKTKLRKLHARLYCQKCGALVYDPKIDLLPK